MDEKAIPPRLYQSKISPGGKLKISPKIILYAGLSAILFLFPYLVKLVSPNSPQSQIPPASLMLIWGLPILILYSLRNNFNQFIAIVWIIWFIVGSVNILAAYNYYGSAYLLDAALPARIYILFTTIFVLGLFTYEKLIIQVLPKKLPEAARQSNHPSLIEPNPLFFAFILIFPFLWFADLYFSLGYIPIFAALQGANVNSILYELNYGRLYGYSIVINISMMVVLDKISHILTHRWFYSVLLIVFVFFTIVTGKRHMIMVFLIAALVYLLRMKRITIGKLFLLGALILGLYAGLVIIRQGEGATGKYSSVSGKLILVGGEYLAFAYTANHVEPGEIDNYNWAGSVLGSALNSGILKLYNLNKVELVRKGSAYTWGYLFHTTLGIRSGIISELYMAYGLAGGWLIYILGIFCGWVSWAIYRASSKVNLLLLLLVYSLLLTAIVGQTTDLIGGLVILLYVWLLYYATRTIMPIIRRPENGRSET